MSATKRVDGHLKPEKRTEFTGDPKTCACIAREMWPRAGRILNGDVDAGSGAWCDVTTLFAMRFGHLECLTYAVENGCEFHRGILSERIRTPAQLECAQYALERGFEADVQDLLHACISCNPELLKCMTRDIESLEDVANENPHLIEVIVLVRASERRAQDAATCIEILRAKGYPWSPATTKCAAERGNVEMLKYVVDRGCPWDEDTLEAARASGNADVIEYAEQRVKSKRLEDIENVFEIIEQFKRDMPETEYADAARAMKNLYDNVKNSRSGLTL